ncbi:Beta-lactamase class C related penicillin binding protein [Companilactobacillus tucceti DSM 20183]|uniref:Beta-lactamase class C related penicillin binding protein n=1 Tax=Companilactobacillus tucceti DSM 20183 TaxID=1423811 RepID=A0A0R1J0K1_9LACO|nr:serine hydrolase domain-containing protein [Companilactobacillus tucceti]KRK64587.1 Beta-lactamase class C related penicillin binding protein [Companilactobacillus tucceti DSM 20183]
MKKFEQTEAQILNLVNKQVVPGVSYGFISNHGKQIKTSYDEANFFGSKSWIPNITPLKGNELYDLASLTKVMGTVPVILKLIDEKKVGLHDPIVKYLPDFKDDRVEIFHLLTHTSGIAGYIPDRDSLNSQQLIDALLNLPVTDNFNKKVVYTDTGMIFLGLIIEKICHKAVQEVIQDFVHKTWNLEDATFKPQIDLCTPTYKVDGKMLVGIPNDPKARQLGEHCGSAGMFDNLVDVMQFAKGMLQSKYKFLYKNFTDLNPGRSLGWDIKPGNILFHTGYTGHFIVLDYNHQNAMVVLTNRVHPVEYNQIFLERRETILNSFINESK